MVAIQSKDQRCNFRLTKRQKELAEKAASITGQDLSSFFTSTMVERATAIVNEYENLVLSDRDRDIFLASLENPPEPNDVLKRAMAKYRTNYSEG